MERLYHYYHWISTFHCFSCSWGSIENTAIVTMCSLYVGLCSRWRGQDHRGAVAAAMGWCGDDDVLWMFSYSYCTIFKSWGIAQNHLVCFAVHEQTMEIPLAMYSVFWMHFHHISIPSPMFCLRVAMNVGEIIPSHLENRGWMVDFPRCNAVSTRSSSSVGTRASTPWDVRQRRSWIVERVWPSGTWFNHGLFQKKQPEMFFIPNTVTQINGI